MRTYDLVLNAGKDVLIDIDYKFFLVLADGGYPFDVTLYKGSINQKCEGVAAGFGLRLSAESRGKKFIFNSANTQTIKVFVGDDEAIYQRLSGSVTVNGGTLAAVTSINAVTTLGGISSTVKVADDGESYGASYRSNTPLLANTPETIVAPGANVNGLIIQRASIYSYSGSNIVMPSLIVKSSAPANNTDGTIVLGTRMGANGSFGSGMDEPLRIPAGLGLYYITAGAEANSHRSVLYTLL